MLFYPGGIVKYCAKCNTKKEKGEFGKDKQKNDELYSYCKVCVRIRSEEQRKKDPEYSLRYASKYRKINADSLKQKARERYLIERERYLEQGKNFYYNNKESIAKKRAIKRRLPEEREKNRIRVAGWRENNKVKISGTVTKWKKNNPKKAAAHALIYWSVAAGVIQRKEKCEECDKVSKTEAHHEDYQKPLDIMWLCKNCHSKKHRIYR